MKTIAINQCNQVAGGVAEVVGDNTLNITGASFMVLHGLEFDSHGVVKDLSGDVVYNFTSLNPNFCYNGVNYTVSAIEDGFCYDMSDC